MDLRFVECPYCGKPFEENDDIVVCPECGTPGHRACWLNVGHCLNEEAHAEGFVWEIPYSKEREEIDRKAREEEAARRAARSVGDGEGAQKDTRPDGMPFDNEYGNYASYTTGEHGEMRPTMRVIGPEEMLGNDFRVREYGDVIKKNKNRYIPKFYVMENTKRNFVANFAAFVFPTLWSAYRRMYSIAILLVILQFLVPVFALDSVVEYYSETMNIAKEYVMTDAQDEEAMNELVEKMPEQPVALRINHYVILFLHLMMGIFANTLYKRHCEQLLTKAKAIDDPAQQAEYIRRRGGTSVFGAILFALILYTAVNLLLSFGMQQGYGQEIAETATKAATKAAETTTAAAKEAKEALIALWRK